MLISKSAKCLADLHLHAPNPVSHCSALHMATAVCGQPRLLLPEPGDELGAPGRVRALPEGEAPPEGAAAGKLFHCSPRPPWHATSTGWLLGLGVLHPLLASPSSMHRAGSRGCELRGCNAALAITGSRGSFALVPFCGTCCQHRGAWGCLLQNWS